MKTEKAEPKIHSKKSERKLKKLNRKFVEKIKKLNRKKSNEIFWLKFRMKTEKAELKILL